MSTTPSYPLATVAAQVTAAGIYAPAFDDILQSFQASMKSIFGSDIYIDPDSKDGQLLAILAQAQYDSNQAAIAVYNAYNPQTAVGTALDSAVKVNGIQRQVATNSTAMLVIGGQAFTEIYKGIVQDTLGRLWDLPVTVTIPPSGTVTVEAVCELIGSVQAAANTINVPFTKVPGWQTVTNPAASVAGAPVETDGELRERQQVSTSIAAETTADALLSRVRNVAGVQRANIYINDTGTTDANGVPGHSFTMVVEGGDPTAVAEAIAAAKDVGAGTAGTTLVTVPDPAGINIDIRYDALIAVPITVKVTIKALANFAGASAANIQASVMAFINSLGIGEDVYLNWTQAAASLDSNTTFVITQLLQARDANAPAAADIVIAFNEAAVTTLANITIAEAP